MDTSLRDWAKTGLSALREPKQLGALARDAAFRIERNYTKRFSDVQLRQLRSLERSYSKVPGPDLLFFGDSSAFWTTPNDDDHRHLVQMVHDHLDGQASVEAVVGPLYNSRIVMAFLSALERSASRPRVAIVPLAVLCAQSVWLDSPETGYEALSEELRSIIHSPGKRPRRLTKRDTEEAVDAYERLPAPSLYGARCTIGELRLITNAVPQTKWQRIIRLRHLMDYYNAEKLEPDSPGVLLAAEMARMLADLEIPSVATIPPSNHEVLRATLGAKGLDQLVANAELLERTYLAAGGPGASVVNAACDHPASDYIDPVHLSPAGRDRYAKQLAEACRPALAGR